MMRAKERKGQCHKYNGKLMRPNHTTSLFDRISRLNQDCSPAAIIKMVPNTGTIAHFPGNPRLGSILRRPNTSNATPNTESVFDNVLPSPLGLFVYRAR